jgi:phosphatidylserine/phosphatidylglycerophosphate/cardiolipin synthase-like enzyme
MTKKSLYFTITLLIIFFMISAAFAYDKQNGNKINANSFEITILDNKKYFKKLISHIRNAKSEIFISMFIFKTTKSPKNRANLIVAELIKAKKKGIDVVVILDKSNFDKNITKQNMNTAKILRKKNIKVIFDKPDTTTHNKVVIIDRRYSFVGSHNFTHSALFYNNEISLLIDNKNLAEKLIKIILHIKHIGNVLTEGNK